MWFHGNGRSCAPPTHTRLGQGPLQPSRSWFGNGHMSPIREMGILSGAWLLDQWRKGFLSVGAAYLVRQEFEARSRQPISLQHGKSRSERQERRESKLG